MKRRIGLAAVVVVVLIVVVAPEATGKGGAPISCGMTALTNAVLLQDLSCAGPGVVVGAAGITIDLNGHTLRGDDGLDPGVDATGGFANVTVKDGVLQNFGRGVNGGGSGDRLVVSNVVATGNAVGLWVVGTSASVSSSNVSGNSAFGLELGGNGASARSVIAAGNGNVGVEADGSGVRLTSVTASGNGDVGISAGGDSLSITRSTAIGNGLDGIAVLGEAANVSGNRVEGNGFASHDSSGLGIRVDSAAVPPTGRKNTARGNDDPTQCNPSYLC
jgi:hypothetical protein